jgi:hypothetical protein
LDWRFGEWGDEFIGVYTDANIVMGAESADFFFDCWHLKVNNIRLFITVEYHENVFLKAFSYNY